MEIGWLTDISLIVISQSSNVNIGDALGIIPWAF